jgi:hypothetical protein
MVRAVLNGLDQLANFTPHNIDIYKDDKVTLVHTIQKRDGEAIRLEELADVTTNYIDGVPVRSPPDYVGVLNMPDLDSLREEGITGLIVSTLVAQHWRDKADPLMKEFDVFTPDGGMFGAVRDKDGTVNGTTGLILYLFPEIL